MIDSPGGRGVHLLKVSNEGNYGDQFSPIMSQALPDNLMILISISCSYNRKKGSALLNNVPKLHN